MKKIFSFFTFLFLLCIMQNVHAAGNVSLSSNKSSVMVGEEFTVSISLSNASVASLTARVTVDTSKVDYVSGPSNSSFRNGRAIYTWTDPNGGESPKTGGTIATFKFKAKAVGSAGFSVSGDFYTPEETAVNPIFSGTTVAIIEKAEPEPEKPTTTPEEPTTPTTPSTPQTPNTEQTPSTSQTPTTPSTPNTPSHNAANGGNLSSNANLKSLSLDVEGLTPNFQSNITQYSVIVDETITDIDVLAVAEDGNSNIAITGNHGLQMGSNTIQIVVTAQNGATKTYSISVTKTEEAALTNAFLENLAIENVTLTPEFRFDIMEYTAEVASNQESLNILAIPQREAARVTIEGNENLQFGENRITVMVTAEDGITTQNYGIIAYRKTEEEEKQEEQNTILEEQRQANDETNKTSNSILATIGTIGVAIVIGIIFWKYRKEKGK